MQKYYKGWNNDMSPGETANLAYWERNMLALHFANYANDAWKQYNHYLEVSGGKADLSAFPDNLPCGWYYDVDNNWEGYKRVISLFDGRVTFHVTDDFDLGNLPQLPRSNWDGHTTEDKWKRVMKKCGVRVDE